MVERQIAARCGLAKRADVIEDMAEDVLAGEWQAPAAIQVWRASTCVGDSFACLPGGIEPVRTVSRVEASGSPGTTGLRSDATSSVIQDGQLAVGAVPP
jgi:hypothetical protein